MIAAAAMEAVGVITAFEKWSALSGNSLMPFTSIRAASDLLHKPIVQVK